MEFRYFITDESNLGSLIIGKLNPDEMFLLLGKACIEKLNKSEIIDFFVQEFHFCIEASNIGFVQLNTDEKFPYTYYNLVYEHLADKSGYFYANISEIKNCFDKSDCKYMLRSINVADFKKCNFS